jgi:putative serine protease PepD
MTDDTTPNQPQAGGAHPHQQPADQTGTEHTTPLPPYQPPVPPPAYVPRQRRRPGAFAASVIAASLVVGAGAGVAGAAAWQEWSPNGADSSTSSPNVSSVIDRGDSPAPAGSVEQVAQDVLPSVVKINVAGPQGAGSGSGIILSSDGEILTNNHVVEAAGEDGSISVSFSDGSTAEATIKGTDPLTDTALIKAEGVSDLTPATIGKSGNLDVGQEVVAIGSPFGLESTVTSGIVSALNRPVNVGSDAEGNSTTYPAIQTDAAINPGNSGGPLVDMNGDVVGINSSIRTSSSTGAEEGGSIGLGFAIPIDEVMPIVEQMQNGETPTHARMGISVSDVNAEQGQPAGQGAVIQEVTEGSTAESAGLEPGDVITKVDDTVITSADSVVATVRSYRPGDEVTVTYVRDGDTHTAKLELDSDG